MFFFNAAVLFAPPKGQKFCAADGGERSEMNLSSSLCLRNCERLSPTRYLPDSGIRLHPYCSNTGSCYHRLATCKQQNPADAWCSKGVEIWRGERT
jgi:hypothetical protein